VPADQDPQLVTDSSGSHLQTAHFQQYSPAVDAQGRADCQTGQTGYIDGPWSTGGKYAPANQGGMSLKQWENTAGGGSHTAFDQDLPGLAGPTYVGGKLGINSLSDVP
jgi:hypothetical protein